MRTTSIIRFPKYDPFKTGNDHLIHGVGSSKLIKFPKYDPLRTRNDPFRTRNDPFRTENDPLRTENDPLRTGNDPLILGAGSSKLHPQNSDPAKKRGGFFVNISTAVHEPKLQAKTFPTVWQKIEKKRPFGVEASTRTEYRRFHKNRSIDCR